MQILGYCKYEKNPFYIVTAKQKWHETAKMFPWIQSAGRDVSALPSIETWMHFPSCFSALCSARILFTAFMSVMWSGVWKTGEKKAPGQIKVTESLLCLKSCFFFFTLPRCQRPDDMYTYLKMCVLARCAACVYSVLHCCFCGVFDHSTVWSLALFVNKHAVMLRSRRRIIQAAEALWLIYRSRATCWHISAGRGHRTTEVCG